ncbi:type 1 glutamine amidotransferase family protein [Halobellus limi]|uniref:hypothetical protein n=1 Tax=Halobellus limi TaxID=699433 RepID=UPI001F3EAD8C|nr:hypothetical protein [Halobellus limi]
MTELGDGTERIATAGYYEILGSRHRDAPLWTVQYHPEFTAALLPRIEADFGWSTNDSDRDFDDASVERTLGNFVRLATG